MFPSLRKPIGYGNPRRMSERDIPSRISHEQEFQMRAHRNNVSAVGAQQQHSAQPRIQGSKSVPTLIDDNPMAAVNGQTLPPLQQRRTNEVPPPYTVGGPHNQYNSMPKSASEMVSVQHMKQTNDAMNSTRNYAPHPSMANYNTIGSYSPSRPDSQMSMNSQQRMSSSQSQQLYPEERHYQNIQLYQIQPTQQKTASNAVPQRMLHSSHTSLQNDGQQYNPQQNPRPLSAMISNREQDQYIGPKSANSPVTPTSPRPPIAINPNMISGADQFHYPQQQQQYAQSRHSQDYNDSQQMDYPSRNYPPPHPPYVDRQRDMMRQEAKMDEMREEVRRRDERMHSGGPQMGPIFRGSAPNGQWPQRPHYYPQQQMPGMNGGPVLHRMAPPPAPKPRPTAQQMLANYNPNAYLRNSYREPHDSIPQTLSHPPPPSVSYRYGPSGYPPSRQSEPRSPTSSAQKTPFSDALNNSNNRVINNQDMRKNNSGVVSPSPWEREEKERVINCFFLFLFALMPFLSLTFHLNISFAFQTTQGFSQKVCLIIELLLHFYD